MRKKTSLYLFFVLSLYSFEAKAQPLDVQTEKLLSTLGIIDEFYVEDIEQEALIEEIIVKTLSQLDPHSIYIPADEVKRMNEPLKGSFEGIGVQFNILDDTIYVVATIPGGPSEKVGIQAGDKIVIIDGEVVAGIGIANSGVMSRLKGPKGTEVTVGIKRSGESQLLDFIITRDKIPLTSIDATYMATKEIGYIKISRFAGTTANEFRKAIAELKSQGMKQLILDLQGNPGGYLNAAFQIADEFLGTGNMIVYTEGANSPRNEMKATAYGNYEEGKLVILVDQFSASASEIVSGAVQDWDRGIIVGRRTFGKGLVQKPFSLNDGSQIRLTIADYYTPSGRFIQKPYDEGSESYYDEIEERFLSGELTDSVMTTFPDSLTFYTKQGRKVYGGGGISPDIYVPIDTSAASSLFSQLRRKGLINKFALEYVDTYRNDLIAFYPEMVFFESEFEADSTFLHEFLTYVNEKNIEVDRADVEKSGEVIAIQLKALIARNLYNTNAFHYVYNQSLNVSYKKAIEVIEQDLFKNYNIK